MGSKVALAYIRAISAPLILSVVTFDYAAGWPGNLSAFAAYRPSARIPLAPPERGGVVSRSFYISRCIPEYSDGPMQKGTCDLSVVKVGGARPIAEWELVRARVYALVQLREGRFPYAASSWPPSLRPGITAMKTSAAYRPFRRVRTSSTHRGGKEGGPAA